ncbi:MAG: hypothetical protein JOY81_04985 [Alphaproteobacteria bacterium]|nr:hypothetical protein [Alphaproteobacteria bacterium]
MALTAADVDRVALDTLNEVHRLSSAPDGVEALRASIAARRELVDSYKAVIRACAEGSDPATMAGLMATTVGRSTAVVVSDRNPRAHADASNRAADRAATQAATELQAEPGDLLRRAHAVALSPDSSLRAVTAAAQAVAEGGARGLAHEAIRRDGFEGAPAEEVIMLRAGAVLTQARNAVNGIGRAMGLDSATRSDHLQVHHNAMSPPAPALLAAGRAALDPLLPTVRIT